MYVILSHSRQAWLKAVSTRKPYAIPQEILNHEARSPRRLTGINRVLSPITTLTTQWGSIPSHLLSLTPTKFKCKYTLHDLPLKLCCPYALFPVGDPLTGRRVWFTESHLVFRDFLFFTCFIYSFYSVMNEALYPVKQLDHFQETNTVTSLYSHLQHTRKRLSPLHCYRPLSAANRSAI